MSLRPDRLNEDGFFYFREKVSDVELQSLRKESEFSFAKHFDIQVKNRVENPNRWLALNAIADSEVYIKFAERLILDQEIQDFLEDYFDGSFILNSFSVLSAVPGDENFSLKIHRDTRAYMNCSNLMLNMLVFIDAFTEENGATHFLPGSHKREEKPTDTAFYSNCKRAIGSAGDVLVFHSDIWHAAGRNLSQNQRRGIAMTFTKPFMKQLVDIPRMIGDSSLEKIDPKMKKILGFTSRVPASLEEWYQPAEMRYYLSEK